MPSEEEEKKNIQVDLWGNEVTKKYELRDSYIEPPFSVMDTKQGTWQRRRHKWKNLGIESELGRKVDGAHFAGRHRQAERSGKKPAGYRTPALNKPRGNIFGEYKVRWTGPLYLKGPKYFTM